MIFEGFKFESELIKAEDQVKMKQNYPLMDDFPVYLYISEWS